MAKYKAVNQERNKRKLTGILSADVAGYSRLMEENEISTIRRLDESRRIIGKLINEYKGRVVDSPGDNILAEFNSVVNAVDCAVNIQTRLKFINAQLPENSRMEFRIGVNLGDVIEEDGSIYGDGVNIAARIQTLAEPGGICVSRTAYDHVKSKLNIGYEYLGEHNLKNISEPVRVYRILTDVKTAGKVIGEKRFLGRISRKAALAVIVFLFIAAAGSIGFIIYSRNPVKTEQTSLDRMAYSMPEKSKIAVLPFINVSSSEGQDYFSDGLTEEIIAGLSKHPDLLVTARNSSFYYKGKQVKSQDVSKELGVRYVLEGSVREDNNKVRISAQLIDAKEGYNIWTETYDREKGDILTLQSEIMWLIFREIRTRLIDRGRVPDFLPVKEDSIEYTETFYLLYRYYKERTPDRLKTAKELADKLLQIAPDPWVYYMRSSILIALAGPLDSNVSGYLDEAEKDAKAVESLDKGASLAILGQLFLAKYEHEKTLEYREKESGNRDKALGYLEKALEYYKKWADISPDSKNAHFALGFTLLLLQRYDESVKHYEIGLNIDRRSEIQNYLFMGISYSKPSPTGFSNLEKAEMNLEMASSPPEQNNILAHIYLTLFYTYEDKMDRARFHVKEILRINPYYSTEMYRSWIPIGEETIKFHKGLLKKAGIPEKSSFKLF
jgi:adenylate cyclase